MLQIRETYYFSTQSTLFPLYSLNRNISYTLNDILLSVLSSNYATHHNNHAITLICNLLQDRLGT
jgi:hypothetical protein